MLRIVYFVYPLFGITIVYQIYHNKLVFVYLTRHLVTRLSTREVSNYVLTLTFARMHDAPAECTHCSVAVISILMLIYFHLYLDLQMWSYTQASFQNICLHFSVTDCIDIL
jgi:hypothetical protein